MEDQIEQSVESVVEFGFDASTVVFNPLRCMLTVP